MKELSAVALLYQQEDVGKVSQRVCSVIVTREENDDDSSIRAKAERYMAMYRPEKIDGYKLVAWEVATLVNGGVYEDDSND